MNISDNGLALIESFEGKRLTAYLDSVKIPTIGVGHTGPEVCLGQTITDAECLDLLRGDVKEAEDAVNESVTAVLNQAQFDALVSLVFNIGAGAFKDSTLLRMLNAGQYEAAADQFQRWDRAGGRELPGLLKRRLAEADVFRGEYTV